MFTKRELSGILPLNFPEFVQETSPTFPGNMPRYFPDMSRNFMNIEEYIYSESFGVSRLRKFSILYLGKLEVGNFGIWEFWNLGSKIVNWPDLFLIAMIP